MLNSVVTNLCQVGSIKATRNKIKFHIKCPICIVNVLLSYGLE